MICQVCDTATADVDAVLFPTDVAALFAMFDRHGGELEGWPSVQMCTGCADATLPVYRALGELEGEQLRTITSPVLRDLCRTALLSPVLLEFIVRTLTSEEAHTANRVDIRTGPRPRRVFPGDETVCDPR